MNASDYIQKAKRTEIPKYQFKKTGEITPRVEHAILGLASEIGELVEVLKRSKIYGEKFDKKRLISDLGDLFWYIALLCDDLHVSFEEVWENNIDKLKKRYPDKYSKKAALDQS